MVMKISAISDDDAAQREVARADFHLSSPPPGTLLLDEWQKLPQVWD